MMNKIKKLCAAAGFALAAAFPAACYAQIEVLDESFDEIATLSGWSLINASSPAGRSWFQGNPGIFGAQAGDANAYIAANYLSARNGAGNIDNWLLTPTLDLLGPTTLSFFARSAAAAGLNDTIEVRFSPGAGSSLAGFTTLLGTVGGVDDFPATWAQFTANIDYEGSGRFAFRYVGDAAASNYVGIDTVFVTTVPEPGAYLMLLAGLGTIGGFAALRRRQRHHALGDFQ